MIFIRGMRVAATVIVCLLIYASLFETINALPGVLFFGAGGIGELWIAPIWGLVFRGPGVLFSATLPMLALVGLFEWRQIRTRRAHVLSWVAAAVIGTALLMLGRVDIVRLVAAGLSGAVAGYLYWWVSGSTAGLLPSRSERPLNRIISRALNVVGLVVAGLLAIEVAGLAWHGIKLIRVMVVEPGTGTPPYVSDRRSRSPLSDKVAMMDFPDAASCLAKDARRASPPDLARLDWSLIDSDSEAEVCIFRLLASNGDVSQAPRWLEAQGFGVSQYKQKDGGSLNAFVMQDGRLSVSANHNIRSEGPKYPTRGFIRRAFRSIAYGMSVSTTWSADGKQLEGVRVGYSTL